MSRYGRVVLAVGSLLVAAGCGHTETHQAMLRAPEQPTGRTVELYMAEQPLPARPFYEIALVQAVGFGNEAHPEDVARALTEKAGRLGCDAVLRTFIDQGYSRAHATGVCVKWRPPRGSSRSRPPVRGRAAEGSAGRVGRVGRVGSGRSCAGEGHTASFAHAR